MSEERVKEKKKMISVDELKTKKKHVVSINDGKHRIDGRMFSLAEDVRKLQSEFSTSDGLKLLEESPFATEMSGICKQIRSVNKCMRIYFKTVSIP
jgi:hypothetical protein